MQIFLVCVGKLKEPFYRDACGEYEKRLSRYHKLSVLEVADERVRGEEDASSQKQALEREGRRILPHLQKGYPVALTLDGVLEDSLSFSARMEGYQRLGRPLVLVMGGSYGLHPEVLGHCRERVSLGMLTFPHNLARLILLEQLYRAAKIEGGEPYHK